MTYVTNIVEHFHIKRYELAINLLLKFILRMKRITVQNNFSKYLFNYYKKQAESFVIHIEKAKSIPGEKNIHQLRVDIKKLRAIFNMLQLLFHDKFNADKYYAVFKPIFKNAGKVREVQLNSVLLSKYKLSPSIIKEYNLFFKDKGESSAKKLKIALSDFKTDRLDRSKIKIKKLLHEVKNKKISARHHLYIITEIQQIEQLLPSGNDPAIMHKIRMHLKSLTAIGLLFHNMSPDKELQKLLTLLKKNGTIIGNWHDKIMLAESLELFLTTKNKLSTDDLILLSQVVERIKKENKFLVIKLKNGIAEILKTAYSFINLKHVWLKC